MSLAERGALDILIDHQFDHGIIPADDRRICRILSVFEDEWEDVRDAVLARFAAIDDGYIHLETAKHREERNAKRDSAIENGKKGGRPKKEPGGLAGENRAVKLNGTQAKATTSTSTSTSITDTEEIGGLAPAALASKSLLAKWNSLKEQPSIRNFSGKRKAALATRLKDPFFRDNWEQALAKIADAPFLAGNNDRGWVATIDWFLKPGSVEKILEGAYAAKPATTAYRGNDSLNPPGRYT